MSDLIQTFFERDLTEEESRKLGGLLEASDEDALRFAALATSAYLATGLPTHHWPGGSHWAPATGLAGKGSSMLFWSLTALGLSGLAAWWWWPKASIQTILPPTAQISRPPITTVKSSSHPVPRAVVPLEAVPGLEGKELNVVVDAPQKSLVTVRVLDAEGKEARFLYTGFLRPGHWSFTWDGLLSSGQAAPAGKYTIQVLSDRGTLAKNVDLTVHP